MNIEVQIVINILISSFVSGLIIFLSKTYISEKIKGRIKFEYDNKLETYKNELKSAVEKYPLYQPLVAILTIGIDLCTYGTIKHYPLRKHGSAYCSL